MDDQDPVSQAGFPLEDLPPAGIKPPRLPAGVLAMGGLFLILGAILRTIHVGWREAFGAELDTLGLLGVSGLSGPESLGQAILVGRLPLYDWIMQGWSFLSGTANLTLLRIPSVIFGILSCVAFLVLAGKYLRGTAFTISAMLFCLNASLIRASNDATPHALLAFLGVLAHLLVIRALDEGELRRWIRYGVVCVFGLLVHPGFWALIAGHFAFAWVCRKRVPQSFRNFATVGTVILAAGSLLLGIFALQAKGSRWELAFPVDDALANMVALFFGDFSRYPTNFFFQAIIYLALIAGLILAGIYHAQRRAEAELLPENVGFIDQTQEVVGNWHRLSLETFLTLQWCAVGGVFVGVLATGILSDSFPVQPQSLLAALAPLCLLLAVGLDAVPNIRVRLGVAAALLLLSSWFIYHSLNDRGFGVARAARIVNSHNFDPIHDRLLFVDQGPLAGAVGFHLGQFRPVGIHAPSTPSGVEAELGNMPRRVQGARRVFVLYYEDRVTVAKQLRSPVREYLANPDGPFDELSRWDRLSRYEPTELRIYQRR